MLRDDVIRLVSLYIEDVWNKGDLAALDNLAATGYAYHFGGQPPRDKSAMRQLVRDLHLAFPDWRVELQDIIADGNTVAVRWSGTVTHGGRSWGFHRQENR
jgi:predicted ester cyclase